MVMLSKGTKLILLFLLPLYSFCQTITCSLKDFENKNIFLANILFKESTNPKDTKEYTIAKDGKFFYELTKSYNSLLIEIRANGYITKHITIENPINGAEYKYELILEKDKTILLDEVIVEGKKKFKVKNDTLTFNVDSYIDGSETKIADVIKKLPGIDVDNKSGEITYKGKSIETVTLDGDNLFGFNYMLGTENINVDMVEQVEAIDNYVENPLLKGIEQDGKVSLNLKLKKGKTDFSGNLDFGTGLFENRKQSYDLNATLLGINKTYKSFATSSYNNIGVNQTPFDYFGFSFNVEEQKEKNYFAEKIIPETRFSNFLEKRRANINNQFFGNYNAIFKLNPKLSVKTNLYYLQDKITTNQLFQNDFQINNETFTTSDNTFITKKPQQYRGDVEIKYNTSKTSLLEYNLRLRQENIETPTTVVQNQNDEFSTFLNTEDFYLKQDLLWTKKLSERKAIQVSLFQSFNELTQRLSITPSVFNEYALNDIQESEFKRIFLEGKTTYLGSGTRDKYAFTFGAKLNQSPFISMLFNSEDTISKNNFDYSQSNVFNTGVYNFNRGKWQISPSYSVRFLNQNLQQKIESEEQTQNDFIFEPSIKIQYILNSVSFLATNFGYNQSTNAEQYFFLNQMLIDNRTTINNLPSLKLQENQVYSIIYFINDLYNQFQLNVNSTYNKSKGNFFANQNITVNTTEIEYFFLPQDKSNWSTSLKVSKYFPIIKSRLQLTSNYSISNYRNVINNSSLRQNRSQFLSNSLFLKTAFDLPINFENTFIYQYSNSKSENQSAFINKFLQNTFNIVIKPKKKLFFILSSDFYIPNTEQSNQQFFFLDATLKHIPQSKKWGASLTMRNITNEKNFEQVQTSDISTTIFRSNLLPRYILLNITWYF